MSPLLLIPVAMAAFVAGMHGEALMNRFFWRFHGFCPNCDRLEERDEFTPSCILSASCDDGDHTYSFPCDYAPGTGTRKDQP